MTFVPCSLLKQNPKTGTTCEEYDAVPRGHCGYDRLNRLDADRHCIWQALTTIRANVDFARKIGDAHEDDHPGTPESREMDQANNQTGRDIGLRHEEDEEGAIDECHAKAEDGQLMVIA